MLFSEDKTCFCDHFLITSYNLGYRFGRAIHVTRLPPKSRKKLCALVWHTSYFRTNIAPDSLSLALWYRNSDKEWKLKIGRGEHFFPENKFRLILLLSKSLPGLWIILEFRSNNVWIYYFSKMYLIF